MKIIFTLIGLLLFPLNYTSAADQPNILVILSDDAGYSDFGFSGAKNFSTPNLNKFASEGIHFTEGYVSASVCSPSRAGLLTGRNQQRFGYYDNLPVRPMPQDNANSSGLPDTEITIADALKENGYSTAVIGKWHLGYGEKFHPNNRGFDYFYGMEGGARSYWPIEDPRFDHQTYENHQKQTHEGYYTDVLTDKAIDWMQGNQEKPFFLYLSYNAVHTPMDAKEDVMAKYAHMENKERQKLAAMTESLDDNIGRVLKSLDDMGINENTLVFFLNDNGGAEINSSDNLPLAGFKGTPLEGGIRVPYLVRWPWKIDAGQVNHQPVSSLDIFATSVAAAGGTLATDRPYDGVNLLPHMTGKKNDAPHEYLFWSRHNFAAVRAGDWKLIRLPDRPAMLFNIKQDIAEQTDRAGDHKDKVNTLLKTLYEWEKGLEHKLFDTEYMWYAEVPRKFDMGRALAAPK